MDKISDLPKEILQRILYFLSQEESVRTSVLSKSWRHNWCTRPNLDLSEKTFKDGTFSRRQKFISTVDRILQRYCDQRLSLVEFHLCIQLGHWDHEDVSLLQKWIPLLTTMGVKEFRFSSKTFSGSVNLPSAVFGSESLTHLHVEVFNLDQKAIETIGLCKNLKSLRLERVYIDDNILQKIIASCPLIETLRVERHCEGQTTIKINDLHHLKDFYLSEIRDHHEALSQELCSIEIYPPSLETINIEDGNIRFHKGANFLNLTEFHLGGMKSSFDHFSPSKFPSLKRLTLNQCDGLKEIELFIDAPNILCFEYYGSFVPSISFATTSNEWKSKIYVEGSLCFLKLYELLESLSQSKISLEICHDGPIQENILVQDNGYTKPVVVKSLGLGCPPSSFSSLLYVAFSICRPRKIMRHSDIKHIEFVGLMWKILMERESGNKDPLTQLLFRDLEEASIEIMLWNIGWRPAPLSEYLLNYKRFKCRFALKWRETLEGNEAIGATEFAEQHEDNGEES